MKFKTFTSYSIVLLILALVLAMMIGADVSTALASDVFQSPTPSETPQPTDEPTTEPTSDPVTAIDLMVNLPSSVNAEQSFSGSIIAQNVTAPGVYGAQLELSFDPNLVMIDSVTADSGFDYILRDDADNTSGKIILVASKTGQVAGLTGNNVTLLTFEATAKNVSGTAGFTFSNTKMSDPQANSINVNSQDGSILIEGINTPVPTDEPTPTPTDEPTPVPTDEPTPTPTDEPTPLPTPTDEPTPVPTPTDEPTPVPTDEPTPIPTDEPTPIPTDEPGTAEVFGQVILAGRANNNWTGADVSAAKDGQPNDANTTTDTNGDFSLLNIPAGSDTIFTANAAGYLSAKCTGATITTPETNLNPITLLSGDITNDDKIDIEDATAVGVTFDQTGSGLAADINQDEVIDIFDLVLVSLNFNEEGPQDWICQ